jgi:hypothetical protein
MAFLILLPLYPFTLFPSSPFLFILSIPVNFFFP